MHAFTLFSTLLFSTAALAQSSNPIASGPFNLVIESRNKTLNGQRLTACHSGAAIEDLCLLGSQVKATNPSDLFYYNTSSADATSGIITFVLPISGGPFLSETMEFVFNPASNVAQPIFQPSDNTGYDVSASFNKNNELLVGTGLDDTTNPPAYKTQNLNRWYICKTLFDGYTYTTLAWTLGDRTPQNPTCQKVSIKRVDVKQ